MKLLSVNYHNVGNYSRTGLYPKSLSYIRQQVDAISKEYEFISHEQLVSFIRSDKFPPKKFCLLTFDDGLSEQFSAYQSLSSIGVPCVFFICSQPYTHNKVLDVHKSHLLRSKVTPAEMLDAIDSICDVQESLSDNIWRGSYIYDDEVSKKAKYILNFVLSPLQKTEFLSILFSRYYNETEILKDLYLDPSQLQVLGRNNCLGCHSASHTALSSLSASELHADLCQSFDFVSQVSGRDDLALSYPYGGRSSFNRNVIDCSKRFCYSLTMLRGLNEMSPLTDLHQLKRLDTNDLADYLS